MGNLNLFTRWKAQKTQGDMLAEILWDTWRDISETRKAGVELPNLVRDKQFTGDVPCFIMESQKIQIRDMKTKAYPTRSSPSSDINGV